MEGWCDADGCGWCAAKAVEVSRGAVRSSAGCAAVFTGDDCGGGGGGLGGRWSALGEHLTQAAQSEHGDVTLASTLQLVKALDRDQQDLAEAIRSGIAGRMVLKGAN